MKKLISIIALLMVVLAQAQTTDPALLVNVQNASQAEINGYATSALEEGMLVYNTDENRIFEYTNAGFRELLVGPNIFVGQVILNNTGNVNVTGLPFRPSQITFEAKPNVESVTINSDNGIRNNDNSKDNTFGSMNGYARANGTTITQQVIFSGGSGNSINDISRYSNPTQCVGLRYTNQNGDNLGLTTASVTSFNANGFTLNVTAATDAVLALYTAYR